MGRRAQPGYNWTGLVQCKSHLTPPISWQVTRRETRPIQSIPTIPSTTAGIWAMEEEEEEGAPQQQQTAQS